MKKVYLINPPTPNSKKIIRNTTCASESKGNYLLHSYDFILLSGVFSKDSEVTYIDALAEDLSVDEVISKVTTARPDLIISAIVDRLWDTDLEFTKRLVIETQKFQTKILVFGDAFLEDYNTEEVLEIVDGIIYSPLELNAKLILETSKKDLKNCSQELGINFKHSTPIKKATPISIPTPLHNQFVKNSYRFPFSKHKKYATVNTTWGCPYSCKYCPASNLSVYFRPAKEVFQELLSIKELFVREVYFADFSFGLPSQNTLELLNLMIENNLELNWSTYFHPNQFSEELLLKMKKAGCHTIIIGIESADIKSLEKYNRTTSLDQIKSLALFCNKIGIEVCADFILGFPDESEKDILNTIKLSLELNIDYASFNIATPLPGSIFRLNQKTQEHHLDSSGLGELIPLTTLSNQEIVRLKNLAVSKFYLRPTYLLKRLFRIKSLEHLLIQVEEMFQILLKAK
jgi:anaerobic magnesium-protoporphyrin IX monomethyl ester cyclase